MAQTRPSLPTPHQVNSDEQPSISPDGTKIAFASNRHYRTSEMENPDLLDIYVMNADGTGESTAPHLRRRPHISAGNPEPEPCVVS